LETPPLKCKLKSAPVKLVICKIDGAEILSFEDKYLSEVQDQYRKNGFPNYSPHTTNDLQINVQNGFQINQTVTKQHHFIDLDQENGVVIFGGKFFVYSINYQSFETFIQIVKMAFNIYQKITQQNLIKSLGIRYIDRIDIEDTETLENYLNKSILSPEYDGADLIPLESRSQFAYKSDRDSVLYLRPISGRNLISIPEDLLAILEPMKKLDKTKALDDLFVPNPNISALLDTDHVINYSKLVKTDQVDVYETLNWLHICCSNIFFNSITPYAVTKWSS
jgi:uncharacterized protein (TIGR04255 family)